MNTTTVNDVISKSKWIKQPINKVWKAITDNEQVSQWLVPTNFKAEVGFEYFLQDPKKECNVVTGKVLEADPYTLVYTWINEAANTVETIVRWELKEENGGTTLEMTHIGISKYSTDLQAGMTESYTSGWKRCFENIGNLLN